ncbi:MAG: MBOAT family protein [Deltaproteobacteria bacterium]|nr:MBOAT family protein [Deltaproteobacteria bacterium]
MVFSSVFFLFLFLPVALVGYRLIPTVRLRNLWLLLASLWFYAWGEFRYLPLLLSSIGLNFGFGLLIAHFPKGSRPRFLSLALAVTVNLGLLVYFKYWCFLLASLNPLFTGLGHPLTIPSIPLPLGISFFTFHALSYLIDVARGQVEAQRSPFRLALYISLFPQLVAGPIIRYGHIAHELGQRRHTWEDSAYGVYRFIVGLAKKVLVANVVGAVADKCFALPAGSLTGAQAALGVLCYTLQIYYDFSGYSDMAIGLGRLFGFHFRENFDLPYWSTSITDFWKRWHISLTSWFRDYLYVPLTGNQFWVPAWRVYLAMFVVFLLCGFWHGASWTFVTWGVLHGIALVAERAAVLKWLGRLPTPVQRLYALSLVMAGWVLFRADSFSQAAAYFGALFRFKGWLGLGQGGLGALISAEGWLAVAVGVLAATPLLRRIAARALIRQGEDGWSARPAGAAVLMSLLLLSAMKLASGSFNPFIYYRF